jgi:hypothetical protein
MFEADATGEKAFFNPGWTFAKAEEALYLSEGSPIKP